MILDRNIIKNDWCDWLRTHNVIFPIPYYINDIVNEVCCISYVHFGDHEEMSEAARRERLRDVVKLLIEGRKVAFGFRPVSARYRLFHRAPYTQPYYGSMYTVHLLLMNQLKGLLKQFDLKP